MPSSSAAARSSVARSSGAERVEALGEEGVLARARRGEQRAPGRRDGDERGAAVGRIGGAGDEPRLLEPADDARDRRALHALARASSLGVSGPWRSIVASAAVSEGERSVPASWRSRRADRAIASRSRVASSVVGRSASHR